MRKEGDNLERDIIVGTTHGSRSRGRPRRSWLNITDWTELSAGELLQAVREVRDGE